MCEAGRHTGHLAPRKNAPLGQRDHGFRTFQFIEITEFYADAPAGEAAGDAKKEKKAKKGKKAEGGEEKKADDKAAK